MAELQQRRPLVTFGDDGTPAADVGWLFVNNHRWPGWHLDVVHAVMPPVGPPVPAERSALHEWAPPMPRQAFAEAEFASVCHLTADADPRLALGVDTDLLVIGPRGPGLLKHLHLGSTADWLLTRPPAPLVIVRHAGPTRRVVVCADGSAHADLAAAVLARLPWISGVDVTVLAVDDGRVDVPVATRAASEVLAAAGADVHVTVGTGKPTTAIDEHITQHRPDLVVLGTRGLTGLRHLRVGSTASAIARLAPCNVLVACDDREVRLL